MVDAGSKQEAGDVWDDVGTGDCQKLICYVSCMVVKLSKDVGS